MTKLFLELMKLVVDVDCCCCLQHYHLVSLIKKKEAEVEEEIWYSEVADIVVVDSQ